VSDRPLRDERRLRIAGAAITTGIVVEIASLQYVHPKAFLAFAFASGALIALGSALALWTIVLSPTRDKGARP
jgi:hypothetical protein